MEKALNREYFVTSLSEELLIYRKRNGLNQSEMADKLGISRSYYSEVENKKTNPSLQVLLNINKYVPIFLNINDADRVLLRR